MGDQLLTHYSNSNVNVLRHALSATMLSLRDETKLFLVRPASQLAAPLPLDAEGSYLCVSLMGEPIVEEGDASRALASNKLHILRQPIDARNRRIAFERPKTLAVVAFFSPRWCLSCPRGPGCKVAHFLLRGGEKPSAVSDQTLDLDDRGRAIAQALLGTHIDGDGDILTIEQSVLALLSWAFAENESPVKTEGPKTSLPPQAALKARQAADIIRQRFDDPPTIAELSTFVGLNETDLKRCFRCLYGKGIAGYSRQRRLETARDLLAHSSLGVAAIAFDVGFSNPSQFARAFRQQYGLNPSEYRRSPP
jgi:AraC-like DNA-binding protein